MAQKPKTRRPATKKAPAVKQKEQSARFIEAAWELGADKTGKDFESAINKIVLKRKQRTLT